MTILINRIWSIYKDGSLITYVQKNGRLPPIEFINDTKKQRTDFCLLEKTEGTKDQYLDLLE